MTVPKLREIKSGAVHDVNDPPVRTVRFELSPRTIVTILGIILGGWLLVRVWQTILIITIALVLAGTFSPVVTWLERRRISRSLALTLVFVGLLGAVIGLGVLVVPALVAQIAATGQQAPILQGQMADIVAQLPVVSGYANTIRNSDPGQVFTPLRASLLGIARGAAELVVLGVTTVVLAIYLIADHERAQGFLFALLPRSYHLRTARILLGMETIVGGYMRGQAVTSIAIGVVTGIVCFVAGVPNALAVAVLASFADLIPFVGSALAIAPAVLLALTHGPVTALGVLIALMVYSQIETHILVPRIYGQSLRLSPIAVIVALLMGGQILGIVGALLALPLAAGIRVLVEDLRIELPGEQSGESATRQADEDAEEAYAANTEGSSSLEASVVATAMAQQMQADAEAATGEVEQPAEEQGSTPPVLPPVPTPTL